MSMKKIIYLMSFATIMCSCRVFLEYQRPEDVSAGSSFRNVSVGESDTVTLARLSWQEFFADSHLQSLIDSGLANNTELQIARLRIEQAEAVLVTSRLAYLPSASLSPQGSLSSFDGSKSTKTYSLAASSSWEIDVFGKLTNANRESKAMLESSKAYEQAVQARLIATTANSYYALLMFDRQLAISLATLENWDESIRTLEALKQAGITNDAAILQAKANRLSLKSSILLTRKSIYETENSLSALLKREPQSIDRGVLAEQYFPETLAVGVPLQLLGNRPDVRQAEYNLAQSFYVTNVARSSFYPNITLGGSAGWTNNIGSAIVNPGELLLSAVGSLTQPLFSKGINTANLKIAKARQEEAKLLFQQSILNAGKEVNDALMQWQTAQDRIIIGEQQIETLHEAVRKTELLMKYSTTNYLEVLTAQQSLLQAEQTQIKNYFDKIQGVIDLYHALGGGITGNNN